MGEIINSESRNESLSAAIRIKYSDLFWAFDPVKLLIERYEVLFFLLENRALFAGTPPNLSK